MALDRGTAFAVYLLLAKHNDPTAPDAKSGLRHAYDDNVAAGQSSKDALIAAATTQLGFDLSGIGDPGDLSPVTLRPALGIDNYTGPDCPGDGDQTAICAALQGNV
jgi:hypothetical protein